MQIYINAFNNKKGINSMKHDARGSSNDLLRVIPDFHMGRTRQDMTHVFFAPRTRGSCWLEYIDAFQT